MNFFKKLFRRFFTAKELTWKDRGEGRGRTAAEPEATLDIKVFRKDGTVEEYHSPAQIT